MVALARKSLTKPTETSVHRARRTMTVRDKTLSVEQCAFPSTAAAYSRTTGREATLTNINQRKENKAKKKRAKPTTK